MIDPLLTRAIAFGFAILFIGAAWHKLSAPERFAAILRDYQLLPAVLIRPLTFLIPAIEMTLVLGWISGLSPWITTMTSAVLLATYALAMTINIVRGRIYIDCGCGFSGSAGEEQTLSPGLVARNILLIGVALLSLVPTIERGLGMADLLIGSATVLIAILLYASSGQLIRNRVAIITWRGK